MVASGIHSSIQSNVTGRKESPANLQVQDFASRGFDVFAVGPEVKVGA